MDLIHAHVAEASIAVTVNPTFLLSIANTRIKMEDWSLIKKQWNFTRTMFTDKDKPEIADTHNLILAFQKKIVR